MATFERLPDLIPYKEIKEARENIKEHVLHIPLVPLNIDWPYGKVKTTLCDSETAKFNCNCFINVYNECKYYSNQVLCI